MTASARKSREGSGARAPSPHGAEGRRAAGEAAGHRPCARAWQGPVPAPPLALGQKAGVHRGSADRVASARPSWVKTVARALSPREAEGQLASAAGRPASVRPRGGRGSFWCWKRPPPPKDQEEDSMWGGFRRGQRPPPPKDLFWGKVHVQNDSVSMPEPGGERGLRSQPSRGRGPACNGGEPAGHRPRAGAWQGPSPRPQPAQGRGPACSGGWTAGKRPCARAGGRGSF